jgi:O-acetylhomoserine (thiol)-lyase
MSDPRPSARPDAADGSFATLQVQAGYTPGIAQNTAIPPIYQSNAYEFPSLAHARDVFALRTVGNVYSRNANPTQLVLEERVARLEGGTAAVAVGSGQAASAGAILALASQGHHIVAARQLYGGTIDLLADSLADLGIEVTFVDQDDLEGWRAAARPETRAFFAETITNPLATVLDVRAIADAAHEAGVPLIVDNTVATPYLLRPGDLVLWERFGAAGQALTVYIKTKFVHDFGPTLAATSSSQLLQGIETLDLRMRRHSDNALEVARVLDAHPAVSRVHHPGLSLNPWHGAAAQYLPRGTSGVFAFDLAGSGDAVRDQQLVERVVDALRVIRLVANIGDARSMVSHPASMTHSHMTPDQLAAAGISPTTIRLSIGLEDPADLTADLTQALSRA